jgi:anti-sigma factor RsiW
MDCRNFHRNLEDYIDGELDFAGRFGMERHAEQCFACGKKLADAHGLRLMTASIARVKAPADFEARLSHEIALRKSQGVFTRVRNCLAFGFEWRLFAFAAAVCAALVFGIFFARQFRLYEPVPSVAENSGSAAEEKIVGAAETPENLKMEALDLLLVSPDNYQTPEQLPRKIYVRYGPPSEEYFIRNVSH